MTTYFKKCKMHVWVISVELHSQIIEKITMDTRGYK